MTTNLQQIVRFYPAYDRRNETPNYGQHCVDLLMVLKGPEGAVQFRLFTGWHWNGEEKYGDMFPMPADLGYHSKVPRYEEQTPIGEDCEFVDGGKCYYDGSGLNAERIYKILLHEGSEGVWRELEKYYLETFYADTEA